MSWKVIRGDVKEVCDTLQGLSFDGVLSDPPYGVSVKGKGWDYEVPKREVWASILRLLRPGAHLISFFSARTYHRGAVNIEDAGFEIRDQLMYLHGQGFPKNQNVGKIFAKKDLDPTGAWKGYGTTLKPAHDPIVLARAPIEGRNLDNCLEHGLGCVNIDGSRAPYSEGEEPWKYVHSEPDKRPRYYEHLRGATELEGSKDGRYPANVLHDDSDCLDDILPKKYFYAAKAKGATRDIGLDSPNPHPSVKSIELTRYLANLILPPDLGKPRRLLVPFCGSGSEMIGALQAGWEEVIGIEMDKEYCELTEKRLTNIVGAQE